MRSSPTKPGTTPYSIGLNRLIPFMVSAGLISTIGVLSNARTADTSLPVSPVEKRDLQGHIIARVLQDRAAADRLEFRISNLEFRILRGDDHFPFARPHDGGQIAILDDRIALERVLPAIVARIGRGLQRVGFEHDEIGRHGLPTRSIREIDRIAQEAIPCPRG